MASAERRPGATYSSKEGEEQRPRLPHERDESSDSQDSQEPRKVIEQAHDDTVSEKVDTDKGQALHDTYQRQKSPSGTPSE